MKARAIGGLAAFLLGGLLAVVAQAAEPPADSLVGRRIKFFTRLRAEQIHGVLEAANLAPRIETDAAGRPRWGFTLGSFNVQLGGSDVANLNDRSYDVIQLLADFQPPVGMDRTTLLERCNEWNRTQRFASAVVTQRPTLALVADFQTAGGVSLNALREFVTLFRTSLTQFSERVLR